MPIDDKDRAILIELQRDSNRTSKAIAQLVGLSAASYGARRERLVDEGYIEKIHAVLDPSMFELNTTGFVLVKFNDGSRQAADSFANFAVSNPNVLEVHTLLGTYDALIKLRARDNSELLNIIEAIATESKISTQTLVVARTHRDTTDIYLGTAKAEKSAKDR